MHGFVVGVGVFIGQKWPGAQGYIGLVNEFVPAEQANLVGQSWQSEA